MLCTIVKPAQAPCAAVGPSIQSMSSHLDAILSKYNLADGAPPERTPSPEVETPVKQRVRKLTGLDKLVKNCKAARKAISATRVLGAPPGAAVKATVVGAAAVDSVDPIAAALAVEPAPAGQGAQQREAKRNCAKSGEIRTSGGLKSKGKGKGKGKRKVTRGGKGCGKGNGRGNGHGKGRGKGSGQRRDESGDGGALVLPGGSGFHAGTHRLQALLAGGVDGAAKRIRSKTKCAGSSDEPPFVAPALAGGVQTPEEIIEAVCEEPSAHDIESEDQPH